MIKQQRLSHSRAEATTQMRSITYLSFALTLSACGSKVDLGDSIQPVGQHPTNTDSTSAGGAANANNEQSDAMPPTAAAGGADGSSGGAPGIAGGTTTFPPSGGAPAATSRCTSISTISGHFNPCGRTFGITYSPDGQTLATTTIGPSPNLHLWRLSDGSLVHDLPGIGGGSLGAGSAAVAFSPDGQHLAVAGVGEGTSGTDLVKVYNPQTGAQERVLQVDTGFFASAVAFSNDGSLLATGGYKGHIEVWRVADGTRVTSIPTDAIVKHLRFSPVGSQLIASQMTISDGAGGATVWDIPSGTMSLSMSTGYGDAVFSPDGTQIAASGLDIQIWDVATASVLQTLTFHNIDVDQLVWLDQNEFVSNDWMGFVKLWARDGSGNFAEAHSWATAVPGSGKGGDEGMALSPDKTQLGFGFGGSLDDGASGFQFLSL